MPFILSLFHILMFIGIHLPLGSFLAPAHCPSFTRAPHLIEQIITGESSNENKNSSDSLDEMLEKDNQLKGVMHNILNGLALCYNALANLLLYPIFSFLLFALSIGALILAGFLIKKVRNEEPVSSIWILCTSLYFLLYIDLFLVVFQKKQILLLFFELEKDFLLIILAGIIGYIAGKFFSSRSFEEKELP